MFRRIASIGGISGRTAMARFAVRRLAGLAPHRRAAEVDASTAHADADASTAQEATPETTTTATAEAATENTPETGAETSTDSGSGWVAGLVGGLLTSTAGVAVAGVQLGGAVAKGVVSGATSVIKAGVPHHERSGATVVLPEAVREGVETTSQTLEQGTGMVKEGLSVIGKTGQFVGRTVGRTAREIREDLVKEDSTAESHAVGAWSSLGTTAVDSFDHVMSALENTVADVSKEASASVVDVVDHSLGRDLAAVVDKGLGVSRDTVKTAYKVKSLGWRKIGKSVAKTAQREAVREALASSPPAETTSPASDDVSDGVAEGRKQSQ